MVSTWTVYLPGSVWSIFTEPFWKNCATVSRSGTLLVEISTEVWKTKSSRDSFSGDQVLK